MKCSGRQFYPQFFYPEVSSILISLDGTIKSPLYWQKAHLKAATAKANKDKILWKIDLGLFSKLLYPLQHQSQFLSLRLALEHFLQTLFAEFHEETIGLIIYEGDLDFLHGFSWSEEEEARFNSWAIKWNISLSEDRHWLLQLYCSDVCVDYLTQLTLNIPDSLPLFLIFDPRSIENPLHLAQLLAPERYERWKLLFSSPSLFYPQDVSNTIGICIPSIELKLASYYESLKLPIEKLLQNNRSFRLISETFLTYKWDGLDYLIFSPNGLSIEGKRKLQGFCAAGGTVVTTGAKIGFAQELTFEEYYPNYVRKI